MIAFLGGLHHWWPKMSGRMYKRDGGRRSSALLDLRRLQPDLLHPVRHGQPGHAAALLRLPRASSPAYHQASTVGSYVLGVGFFIMAGYLLHSLFRGETGAGQPVGRQRPWSGRPPRRRPTTTSTTRCGPAIPTIWTPCAGTPRSRATCARTRVRCSSPTGRRADGRPRARIERRP